MMFLFAGEDFYPRGGMADLHGTFPDRDSAMAYLARRRRDDGETPNVQWYQLAQLRAGQLVEVEDGVVR